MSCSAYHCFLRIWPYLFSLTFFCFSVFCILSLLFVPVYDQQLQLCSFGKKKGGGRQARKERTVHYSLFKHFSIYQTKRYRNYATCCMKTPLQKTALPWHCRFNIHINYDDNTVTPCLADKPMRQATSVSKMTPAPQEKLADIKECRVLFRCILMRTITEIISPFRYVLEIHLTN